MRKVFVAAALLALGFGAAQAAYLPIVYDLTFNLSPGVAIGGEFLDTVITRAMTLPAGLSGSRCFAVEGATGSTTISINRVVSGAATSIGTATFAAGGTAYQTCTFTFASTVALNPGDIVQVKYPNTADATLGDITIVLAGQ